jgi:hypothetical protein
VRKVPFRFQNADVGCNMAEQDIVTLEGSLNELLSKILRIEEQL